MNEIKLMLFSKCYFAYRRYLDEAEGTDRHIYHHGEFCGLYDLIIDLGLETEYFEWKEVNGVEQDQGVFCEAKGAKTR